jgi:tetratricopeptide (TPR) repeat protein
LSQYALARAYIEDETPTPDQIRRLADLCGKTAEVHEKRSEYDMAFGWIEKGLAYLGDDKLSTEAANLYLIGARAFDHQGKTSKAIDWCQTSLAIAAQIKTRESQQTMGEAYSRLASICLLRGYFDLVVHFSQESVQLYQQIDEKVGQITPYINLGIAYFYQGHWAEASNTFAKSLGIAQEIGSVDGQNTVSLNLANIHLSRGDWSRAAGMYRQCATGWKQIGAAKHEAKALSNLAQVFIYQENWPEAYDCLTRSQTIFIGVGSDEHTAELESRWAEFYLKTRELDQALIYSRRSLDLATEQANPLDQGRAYHLLGQIHQARGESEAAWNALQQGLKILNDLNTPHETAKIKLSMVGLAQQMETLEKAKEYLVQALQTFEQLGAQADLAAARELEHLLQK